jgi:hypothetical protein
MADAQINQQENSLPCCTAPATNDDELGRVLQYQYQRKPPKNPPSEELTKTNNLLPRKRIYTFVSRRHIFLIASSRALAVARAIQNSREQTSNMHVGSVQKWSHLRYLSCPSA